MVYLDLLPLGECLALGIDLGLFFLFRALLRRHQNILNDIREAPKFDNYAELKFHLEQAEECGDLDGLSGRKLGTDAENCVPYAVIRGRVEAIDAAIPSQFVSHDSGVMKSFTIKDHKVERSHGLWLEKAENIHESTRKVPFKIIPAQQAALQSAALLKTSAEGVEFCDVDKVDNPLYAELDVTYDKFEPSQAGFGRSLMDNFRGDVSKGIQETETMLLVGTNVTAIGRVVMKGGDAIRMVYPTGGYEYILTKKTPEEIISGYGNVKISCH